MQQGDAVLGGPHVEGDAPAFDRRDLGLGHHLAVEPGRGDVGEVEADAERGFAGFVIVRDRAMGGLLAPDDERLAGDHGDPDVAGRRRAVGELGQGAPCAAQARGQRLHRSTSAAASGVGQGSGQGAGQGARRTPAWDWESGRLCRVAMGNGIA